MYYFFTKRQRYFKNKISEKYSIGGDPYFDKFYWPFNSNKKVEENG